MDGYGATFFETPLGLCGLAWTPRGVKALQLPEETDEATRARLIGAGRDVSEARRGRRPGSHVCTLRDGTAGVPTILLGVEG